MDLDGSLIPLGKYLDAAYPIPTKAVCRIRGENESHNTNVASEGKPDPEFLGGSR